MSKVILLIISLIFLLSLQFSTEKKFLSLLDEKEKQKEITYNPEVLNVPKISGNSLKKYFSKKSIFIIDVREIAQCAKGYLPETLIIPESMFSWFPSLIHQGVDLILITEQDKQYSAINATLSLGNYNILGYSWFEEISEENSFNIQVIKYNINTYEEIEKLVKNTEYILDVREIQEFKETGVINEAELIPLSQFQVGYTKIPQDRKVCVYCKSGMRAVLAMTFAKKIAVNILEPP